MGEVITYNPSRPLSRESIRIGGQTVAADRFSADWKMVLAAFISSVDRKPATREAYRKALVQFFRWVERTGRTTNALAREDILAFKDYLLAEDGGEVAKSELTAGLYLTALRRLYAWLEGEKIYPNIARDIQNPRRVKGVFKKMHLTDDQGAAYLDAFEDMERRRAELLALGQKGHRNFSRLHQEALRDYAIVSLMLYCGLRTMEVSSLDVQDITFKAGVRILMVKGKGHSAKDDYVALIDEAYRPVVEYLKTRPGASATAPLFTCVGYGSEGRRVSTRRIQKICKDGFGRIELYGHAYSAHSLRHTTGVMIVKRGGGLLDVQEVLRHSNPATSEIYLRSAMEEIRLQHSPEQRLSGCFGRGVETQKPAEEDNPTTSFFDEKENF